MRIFVLLHVEVDELRFCHPFRVSVRIVDGSLVEFRHPSHEFREAFLVVQRMGLGIDA